MYKYNKQFVFFKLFSQKFKYILAIGNPISGNRTAKYILSFNANGFYQLYNLFYKRFINCIMTNEDFRFFIHNHFLSTHLHCLFGLRIIAIYISLYGKQISFYLIKHCSIRPPIKIGR